MKVLAEARDVTAMRVWMAGGFVLVAMMILAFPGSAQAEGSMSELMGHPTADFSPEGIFERIDQSGDGKINRAELSSRKMNVFFVRDQNQDSHLSREEFGSLSDSVFDALDEDKDGRISGFEFNQSQLTKFETIDTNGDNVITFEEFQAFRVKIEG